MQPERPSLGSILQSIGCASCTLVLLVPMLIVLGIVIYSCLATWLDLFLHPR